MMLIMFFGMRRYNDIMELSIDDISILESGDLEFYIRKSKTDQEGRGSIFHMSGEKYGGFSIPGVLCWDIESTGLRITDYLFPRFRGTRDRRVEPVGRLAVGYSTSATQLKDFCMHTMHSGHRGAATAALELYDQLRFLIRELLINSYLLLTVQTTRYGQPHRFYVNF